MSVSAASKIRRSSFGMFRYGSRMASILCAVVVSFMADCKWRNQVEKWINGSHRVNSRIYCYHDSRIISSYSSSSSTSGAGEG